MSNRSGATGSRKLSRVWFRKISPVFIHDCINHGRYIKYRNAFYICLVYILTDFVFIIRDKFYTALQYRLTVFRSYVN